MSKQHPWGEERLQDVGEPCHSYAKKLRAERDRYKKSLEEISNNHFECDGGEACEAHNIAKKALAV